jgi:hypothetical protein
MASFHCERCTRQLAGRISRRATLGIAGGGLTLGQASTVPLRTPSRLGRYPPPVDEEKHMLLIVRTVAAEGDEVNPRRTPLVTRPPVGVNYAARTAPVPTVPAAPPWPLRLARLCA